MNVYSVYEIACQLSNHSNVKYVSRNLNLPAADCWEKVPLVAAGGEAQMSSSRVL